MKEITINKNDAGQRLDKFILKAFPKIPKSLLYKTLRMKDIKRNGKRAFAEEILEENDILRIYLKDEFFEQTHQQKHRNINTLKLPEIPIVFENEDILIVNKPINLECQPSAKGDSVLQRIQQYLIETGSYIPNQEQSFAPALCNRLDLNTMGLVIAAKNASSLRYINQQIRDGNITKKYLCICVGTPPKQQDILCAFHEISDQNRVKIHQESGENRKEIKTGYRLLEQRENLSLLEITLYTGRKHQIRAQMAKIGLPVLGDFKYGNAKANRSYHVESQMLCAYALTFDNGVHYQIPIPGSFRTFFPDI